MNKDYNSDSEIRIAKSPKVCHVWQKNLNIQHGIIGSLSQIKPAGGTASQIIFPPFSFYSQFMEPLVGISHILADLQYLTRILDGQKQTNKQQQQQTFHF